MSSFLPTETVSAPSDTALGDWYVNRVVVDRRPLLLLVSSASLLPMLAPARDVRSLPDRLSALVASRLQRAGIDAEAIVGERQAMLPVAIAPTVDRSVVGIMVDYAKAIPYYLDAGAWTDETLPIVEARLADTPCHAASFRERVIFPEQRAPELLHAKWLTHRPPQPTEATKGTRDKPHLRLVRNP